jgi:Flp pilus assembly protein TadD
MYRSSTTIHSPNLLFTLLLVLLSTVCADAQNSISASQPRNSVSVLDSTKELDGLIGSVRRVKTEAAKVEVKEGKAMEGPLQLLELTTYSVKGNRIENVSYPSSDPVVGKEEYKYDGRGNITEMTLRDDHGAIISRESYSYEFDNVGNWTKMVTSLILFENGRLKREPVENTYRTITYYFDDNIAKMMESPGPTMSRPQLPSTQLQATNVEDAKLKANVPSRTESPAASVRPGADPPTSFVSRQPSAKDLEIKPSAEPASKSSAQPLRSDTEIVEKRNEAPVSSPKKTNESPKIETPTKGTTQSSPSGVDTAAAENVSLKASPAVDDAVRKAALNFYETGLAAFDAGDPKAAIGSYQASLKLQPSAAVYLNLGNAYLKLEKDSDAAKAFKLSVKLAPTVAEAQYGLGLACFRLKRYMDARDGFKKAIELQPTMAKAHYGLGLSFLELDQPDSAVVEVRMLESLDKSLAKKLADTFPRMNYPCRANMPCQ